jgi:hypothetical protein
VFTQHFSIPVRVGEKRSPVFPSKTKIPGRNPQKRGSEIGSRFEPEVRPQQACTWPKRAEKPRLWTPHGPNTVETPRFEPPKGANNRERGYGPKFGSEIGSSVEPEVRFRYGPKFGSEIGSRFEPEVRPQNTCTWPKLGKKPDFGPKWAKHKENTTI